MSRPEGQARLSVHTASLAAERGASRLATELFLFEESPSRGPDSRSLLLPWESVGGSSYGERPRSQLLASAEGRPRASASAKQGSDELDEILRKCLVRHSLKSWKFRAGQALGALATVAPTGPQCRQPAPAPSTRSEVASSGADLSRPLQRPLPSPVPRRSPWAPERRPSLWTGHLSRDKGQREGWLGAAPAAL